MTSSARCAGPSIFDEPDEPVANKATSRPTAVQAASLQSEIEKIRTTYSAEFAAAAKTPAARAGLAKKLLAAAGDAKNLPARLGLLQTARDLAWNANDLALVSDSINRINSAISGESASARAGKDLSRAAMLDEVSQTNLMAAGLAIGQAVGTSEYELAGSITAAAQKAAHLAHDSRQIEKTDAMALVITETITAFRNASSAKAALKKNPMDSSAYLAIGRFECFFRGRWDAGLPKLAGSLDPVLKPLAIQDLDCPQNATEQTTLGDAWFKVDEQQSPLLRPLIYLRAMRWYQSALSNLTGAEREHVVKKLGEIYAFCYSDSNATAGSLEVLNTVVGVHLFTIDSKKSWQPTATVRKGQHIRITATGEWCGKVGERDGYSAGPEGKQIEGYGLIYCLEGKIGNSPVFRIGSSLETVATQDGLLEMEMRDGDRNDNDGEMIVTVVGS